MRAADDYNTFYPVEILSFEERGANVKDFGAQVSEELFAQLVANSQLMLVDRVELSRTPAEQSVAIV